MFANKKKNGRGQYAVEQLFAFAFIGIILVALSYFAFNYANDGMRISQAQDVVNKLANAADNAYTSGPGSKSNVQVYMPNGVTSFDISDHVVKLTVSTSSGEVDVFANTKASLKGEVALTPGLQEIPIEVDAQGEVIIGPVPEGADECEYVCLYDGRQVEYTVVRAEEQIKFESISSGLGEDEADTFVITVSGGSNIVNVKTKAATQEEWNTLEGECSSVLDSLGFRVTLISIEGEVYTFTIINEQSAHALSHVEFDFGDGATVTSPSAGSTTVTRHDCTEE